MKILEKSITSNGMEIQLEDWNGKLSIGAYPIAKNGYGFVKYSEKFRLTISENQYIGYSNDDVRADFEKLKSGEKQLEEMERLFWNGKKDAIMLGIA